MKSIKLLFRGSSLPKNLTDVCFFYLFFVVFGFFKGNNWYWMMLFFVEGIKICLYLSSGEFFSACFSSWSRDICCFEICVCSSLSYFPLLSDDVVMSLGRLLSANCPEREPGQENEEKKKSKHIKNTESRWPDFCGRLPNVKVIQWRTCTWLVCSTTLQCYK